VVGGGGGGGAAPPPPPAGPPPPPPHWIPPQKLAAPSLLYPFFRSVGAVSIMVGWQEVISVSRESNGSHVARICIENLDHFRMFRKKV
jgi:hypothetical protein